MRLAQLLDGVLVTKLFQITYGRFAVTHDVEIRSLQYDSRKVQRGDCFVAIRGTGADGHRFVGAAINSGAAAVVLENDAALPESIFLHAGVIKIVVPDSRKALALMSANYYGHPSHHLTMVGVTGTNGKTTTTHIIRSILEAAGQNVGLIGTIEYNIGSQVIPASHTTPESLELNQLLARMVESGCSSVSMEVSSHALHQYRIHGLQYNAAVFTNLTQDHLDYHGSMGEYFEAKKLLFDGLPEGSCAVTNADDEWGWKILGSTRARQIAYGVNATADVQARDIQLSLNGTSFTIWYRDESTLISSPLVGRFNVYNILAAFSAGIALELSTDAIATGIADVKSVRGRFERIPSPRGWTAVIDYAHTPDALEKCLQTIRDVLPEANRGRIVTVFGAGGDRDRTKRPLMGSVVGSLSDLVVVTSDNPRTEDPQRIMDDIIKGIPSGVTMTREVDRRTAIEAALRQAKPGDVILIAGKGHEDYQVIGEEKIHFSDREIVEEVIRS
ncbi:MAG: UDP-N-acetylmuramoyl-L-alanyl-D-glutamate--2,6-diaminopimelate ligase [Ignavibacteria bacterium]|nr:UDP-N-acetylmuramoyl-L-alanyl-D-glutamate--2,6-diaminopimelate ligase [Ignavibacteria bacterium]